MSSCEIYSVYQALFQHTVHTEKRSLRVGAAVPAFLPKIVLFFSCVFYFVPLNKKLVKGYRMHMHGNDQS